MGRLNGAVGIALYWILLGVGLALVVAGFVTRLRVLGQVGILLVVVGIPVLAIYRFNHQLPPDVQEDESAARLDSLPDTSGSPSDVSPLERILNVATLALGLLAAIAVFVVAQWFAGALYDHRWHDMILPALGIALLASLVFGLRKLRESLGLPAPW